METEHTPGPWKVKQYKDKSWGVRNVMFSICNIVEQDMENRDNGEEKANADFICLAVNSHDDLLAALVKVHNATLRNMAVGRKFALISKIAREALDKAVPQ